MMFSEEIMSSARLHALSEWPKESCGLVLGDHYVPMENVHEEPEINFKMPMKKFAGLIAEGRVKALIHSHTQGQDQPSLTDMEQQVAMGIPWGIIVFEKGPNDRAKYVSQFFFGDGVPEIPYINREFRHGVTDCYELLRDWEWREHGRKLPPFPRDVAWWDLKDGEGENNLLLDNFESVGYRQIPDDDNLLQHGDVLLAQVNGKTVNHVGIYLDGEGILHHLALRASRIDPFQPYRKYITHRLRWSEE